VAIVPAVVVVAAVVQFPCHHRVELGLFALAVLLVGEDAVAAAEEAAQNRPLA
jgi:hypothetical protein